MNPHDIIRYIVWFATENDIRLTTNRLVKFIYLADLYYARLKGGKTLTGFPWKFIYYGPYCREAMQCIDQVVSDGLICKETYESYFGAEKEYYRFTCKNENAEKIKESIHIGVLAQIQKAIRELGDDTPQLLDYVYFDTEPMAGARKGDLLDFSKAEKSDPIKKAKLKKLSPETIKLARQKIKQLSDQMNADRERLIKDVQETVKYKDDAYYQFIEMLDGEELAVGLRGTAKIQIVE
jgi:hypothetical protein